MMAQNEVAGLDDSYRLSATRVLEEYLTRNSSYRAISLAHHDYLLGANPFFFFQADDGIPALYVTAVQTCALPIFGLRLVESLADRWGMVRELGTRVWF